ncbi:MAG: alginate lyase family protein, partial [Cyanobacteria bacterium J06598_1]
GIIDTKDLYYFLDAVRLLRQGNAWSDADHQQMKAWCQAFLDWLRHSPQGQAERFAENNHATCYDLQIVALAGFCDDAQTLFKTLEYSKLRIAKHFDPTGKQPQELKRTDTLHYCTFNLQNWTTLAKIAEQVGVDLWHYTAPKGESLAKAFEWLLPYYQQPWPYAQNKAFNLERFLPLYYIAFDAYPSLKNRLPLKQLPPINDISPHPYTGIPSYWVFAFKDIPLSAAYTD